MGYQQGAGKPSALFVAVVIFVALAIPALIVATLAFDLQPPLSKGSSGAEAGAVVLIPVGAGINQSLGYEPASITVIVGDNNTLVWNEDDPIPHTVTSVQVPGGVDSFDSGNLNKGDSFKVTLNVPGTYLYHCNYHGWMKGTIVVKASR